MNYSFLVAAALLAFQPSPDLSISGTEEVVPVGRSTWLLVEGVSVEELRAGAVDIFPKGYLQPGNVRVLQDLRGDILLWIDIAAANPLGQYDVMVTVARMQGDTPAIHRMTWSIKTQRPNPPPGEPEPEDPSNPDVRVSRVTYVYEKDSNPVPSGVGVALSRINKESPEIVATEFEDDTTDGDGQVPDQYAAALRAAKEDGLPALVVEGSDGSVLRVVRSPKTESDVMEAIEWSGLAAKHREGSK